MKAVTLWQPWASLIAAEVKRFETRSWAPPEALIGTRIAVHAAARKPEYALNRALETEMEARPESEFTTIRDLNDRLSSLVSDGLGDLPVQVLVVPDSTLQAIARVSGGAQEGDRPALMIELGGGAEGRIPVSIVSTDRMQGRGMPLRTQ